MTETIDFDAAAKALGDCRTILAMASEHINLTFPICRLLNADDASSAA